MRGELEKLKADMAKLAPKGRLIIHVRDPKTGRERIVRKPWGGPRDVHIDADEQDLKL